jgi:hypothetical protein
MNTNKPKPAAVAFLAHLEAMNTLLLDTMHQLEVRRENAPNAAWADEGTLRHARELAVQLAWTMGVITAADAKAQHGVTL